MKRERIGPKIKSLRTAKSITQQQLADALGYSDKSMITHIEKGDSDMTYEKILLLLRTYQLDANELFDVKMIDDLLEEHKRKERERIGYEKDILFELNDMYFSYRVGGVLIKDNKILLTRGGNDYSLPGGHVQIGESSNFTIVREFKEETGYDIETVNVISTFENFFSLNNKPVHQVCIFYKVKMIDDNQVLSPNPDTNDTELVWVELDRLKGVALYPIGLAEQIIKNEVDNHHFVYKD